MPHSDHHVPFHGRRPVRVLGAWALTLLVEAFLYHFSTTKPAWSGMVRPLLPIILLPAIVATWRWLRPRSASDRRDADRRRHDRRDRDTVESGTHGER